MLGLKAKAGLLFFVSAGIFTGLVVFGNVIAPKKINAVPEKQDPPTTAQAVDSLQNAIGPTSPLGLLGASEPENINTLTANTETSANLTANLASLIGKNIVDKNPEGPQNGGISVADANAAADEVMTQSMNSVDLSGFYPIISANELTIGSNKNWASDIQVIFENHINTLKNKKVSASFKDDAHTVLLVYADTIANLKEVTTPAERIAENQQFLSLLEGEHYALKAVEQYESDPIRGIIGLRMLEELELKLKQAQSRL